MSEEKKKRKEGEAEVEAEKAEKEEALGIGRILGVIARRNPDLYRAIVQLKEMEGRKLTDIIEEALQMYIEFRTSFAIMPRELFYALRIVDFVSTKTMEQLAKVLQILAAMMQFIVGYGAQSAEYVAEEGEKKEEKKGVPAEIRAKLIDAMLPVMQSIISMLMQTITRAALPPQLQQQMQQQLQLQAPMSLPSKKIKVVASAKQAETASSSS